MLGITHNNLQDTVKVLVMQNYTRPPLMLIVGEAEFYLGCHILRNREERMSTSDQDIYAHETMAKWFPVIIRQ